MRRLLFNRWTFPAYRACARFVLRYRRPRRFLNRWYQPLDYPQKARIHILFAQAFARGGARVSPGYWEVLFAGRPLKMPLQPGRMWLDWALALAALGHEIEIKQTYEHLLYSGRRPDLFIDVGANFGSHSLLFLKHDIDVISFEPNSTCEPYFQELCALNGVAGDLRKFALGDREGAIRIKYPPRETWLGSVDAHVQHDLETHHALQQETVRLTPLDHFLPEFEGRNILIKIDTEGSELDVLKGASRTIERHHPAVIFECWRGARRNALHAFFSNVGYQIFQLPWTDATRRESLTAAGFDRTAADNFIALYSGADCSDVK